MANNESSSFLTSVPGVLSAVGTLIVAAAAVIGLLVHSSQPKPLHSTVLSAAGKRTVGPGNHSSSANTVVPNGGSSGSVNPGGGNDGEDTPAPSTSPTTSTTSPTTPAISGVTFTGSTQTPTVTITGQGFGASPTGQLDDSTTCGDYTNNGDVFGASNLSFQDGANFAAGMGTPPSASCIGIVVLSWSSDQIVYQFGSAYDSFDHWYISPGDQYTVSVMGVQSMGTVTFS